MPTKGLNIKKKQYFWFKFYREQSEISNTEIMFRLKREKKVH